MRNLRKLTAVVIAIALVLTSMTAAFAATSPVNADKAAVMKDLGLYAGVSDADVAAGLSDALTTQDSLIFLSKLFGYSDAAGKLSADEVTKALAKFADAKDIASYAQNVVAYSAINGILSGSTKDGKFFVGAKDTVTAARFATFMLKQMGYTVPKFTEAVAQIANVKGSKVDAKLTGDLTRDIAVGAMYGTLTAEKASGKTVIADIVGTDAKKLEAATKAGLIVNTDKLDVASVTANNLRQLVITFTKAVTNTDEAKKASNYKIGDNNPEAADLSADNMSVTLRTSSANAMGNYGTVDLTIEKAVGFDATKTVKGIAVKDTTVPSAVSVKTTGPKTIKVTLSEPLKTHKITGDTGLTGSDIASSVKIDGGLIAINPTSTTISGVELTLDVYSDLAETSHKVEFVTDTKLIDNAGYKLQASTLTFDYVKDTSDLTISVVESNETSVTFKFNKAIDTTTLLGNADVKIRHSYNTDFNQVTGTSTGAAGSITDSGDHQKFTVTFPTGKPLPPATTTIYIDGYDKIKDCYGNKNKTASFTVTTNADLTKPTATAEFVDAKTVKVTYSEDVKNDAGDNAANNKNNYVLKCGSDVVAISSISYDPSDSKKVLKLITADDKLNGTTYTLTIKNVKDTSVAANQIDEVTLTFTGTDKVAPAVDSVTLVANNKLKIKYTEAMDVATITNKTLYNYDSAALKDDDTVEAVDSNKAALITFKTAPAAGEHSITIGWVKDVAGNYSKKYQEVKTFTGLSVAKIALKEYQIVAKDQIKLKFEDTLKDMIVNDFNYAIDGVNYTTPKSISVSIVDGNTYITLYTNDLGTTTGASVTVKSVGTTSTKNGFDSTVEFTTTTGSAIDKCAPAVAIKAGTTDTKNIVLTAQEDAKDTSDAKSLATVVITYTEAIYASSVQESDYTVAGYEVSDVAVSGNKVTITVKNLDYGSFVLGTTEVKVKQVGEIQDSAKNTLGAQDEYTVK